MTTEWMPLPAPNDMSEFLAAVPTVNGNEIWLLFQYGDTYYDQHTGEPFTCGKPIRWAMIDKPSAYPYPDDPQDYLKG